MMKFLTHTSVKDARTSLGFLALRLLAGVGMMMHGWGKIQNPMGWMGPEAPVPGILQALAAISEFGGGLAWVIGLLTPLASFGLVCTMAVAAKFHIDRGDPFVSQGGASYELAALYLVISVLFLFAGAGRFSIDAKISK